MNLKGIILWVSLLPVGFVFSQVESMSVGKEKFLNPTINSVSYLMNNIDSVIYNQVLLPLGLISLPSSQKVNALEYKKSKNGITQYIGFDDRFGVLTVTWKDESGKNFMSSVLKKSLKGKEHTVPGCYKTMVNTQNIIICIESKKDKTINEMITVEFER